jgi:hypothetical protein
LPTIARTYERESELGLACGAQLDADFGTAPLAMSFAPA